MIEIKTSLGDWFPVDEQTARKYVRYLMKNISVLSGNAKIRYIEKNHLRNITVKDLMKGGEL